LCVILDDELSNCVDLANNFALGIKDETREVEDQVRKTCFYEDPDNKSIQVFIPPPHKDRDIMSYTLFYNFEPCDASFDDF